MQNYEREGGLVKDLVLSIHLLIFEPKHMSQFLKYDWVEILQGIRFRVNEVEKCFFSKLISATKQPNIG